MREAVGGSLLFYLIIPIIILFIVFIGLIMNYAAAYRAANYVVTQIENCQGQMSNCGSVNMENITKSVREKYSYIVPNNEKMKVCYIVNGSSYVFRVELPVEFEIPLLGLGKLLSVKAETKSISKVPSNSLSEFSKC